MKLFNKLKRNFKKTNRTFNGYKHVYEKTFPQPASAGLACWNNIHGYAEPNGNGYYACVDMRVLGIRVQDIVVHCLTEERMKEWCNLMKSSNKTIEKAKSVPHESGPVCNTCFTFKTTDGDEKSYNVTCRDDFYVY